jgi:hypothetical protein
MIVDSIDMDDDLVYSMQKIFFYIHSITSQTICFKII